MRYLFFVLVDLFEVLVGVYLQFAAGDDAVRVQLQCADSPGMIHAALHAMPQSAGFGMTVNDQQNLLGIATVPTPTDRVGGFTKNVTVFMVKNLIAAENVTTPLRQKAGITSLVMHLKTNAQSNEVKVHIQSDTLAEELENLLIL